MRILHFPSLVNVDFTQTWYLRRRGNSGICPRSRGPSRRSERDCQIGLSDRWRESRICALAPNHNRRSCIETHDVPLHLVHPLRVERLREAVDHDHQLPDRRVLPQSTEALVRRFVGQVRRLDLATVGAQREINQIILTISLEFSFTLSPFLPTWCHSWVGRARAPAARHRRTPARRARRREARW